jgi:hypothetical protein
MSMVTSMVLSKKCPIISKIQAFPLNKLPKTTVKYSEKEEPYSRFFSIWLKMATEYNYSFCGENRLVNIDNASQVKN